MIQRADSNRKTLLALLVVLAGLLVLRYCAFGLSYYPQLDDYIQYCNYRQSTEPFWEMALRVGLLASRPLANIADYFIWSPLFDHMLVGVALVCVLYVAGVGMVWSLLRRYFPVGPVFPVVMTLLPLGMEGLYWMSASTRIVGGMFFGCLGAMAFARWLDTGRWYWLAVLYSVFGVFTVFGTGNATQVNTITASINTALSSYGLLPADAVTLCRWIIGVAIALILMLVLLGGIKRIGRVTERLVPFMALLYVVLALGVVVLNAGRIPAVLGAIVTGAFSPMAVTGGIVGSFFTSMQKGVARGIFSNEAGLGTGSIAHACADTQEPVRQGLFGIYEVFADTIVICTLTALVILLSGVPVSYGQAAGAELTISGFVATYGNWVTIFTAVAMCCFAFSTIIGWGLYGARCVEFLFSSRAIAPFMVVYSLVAILGATADLGLLWSIAETFNGLMSIPNLIALFLLSGTLLRLVRGALDGGRAPRGRA